MGCGPVIALGLARCFGDGLLSAIERVDMGSHEADGIFTKLREQICIELETNSRGFFEFCHPAVAKGFPDVFPDRDVLRLYHSPAVSSSSRELVNSAGPSGSWPFQEPSISGIARFGQENFGWKDEIKLKEGMNRMWEGILSQMLYSVRYNFTPCPSHSTNTHMKPLVMYDAATKCLMTPTRQSTILDARLLKQQGYLGKGLPCPRITASVVNLVRLVDPGFSVNNLQPLKLWVPSSLLPRGLVIQGRIQLKKRAKYALGIGEKKLRKVFSQASSTECVEMPESSSMAASKHQASSHVQVVNSLSFNMTKGGEKPKAKPCLSGELIDLTHEDGTGSIPQFDGEVIDLTGEGEETLVGDRSATPWVNGDCIDLTI